MNCPYCKQEHDGRLACPEYRAHLMRRPTPFDDPSYAQAFIEANDKPPRSNWLKLECILVEVGAWVLCIAFMCFCIYVGRHLKP